jgi:hypothetical protein
VVSFFDDTFGDSIHDIGVWYTKTKSDINLWKDWAIKYFEEWRDKAVDWFDEIFTWWDTKINPLIQKGKDIVQGLWDGMEEVWGNFMRWWNGVWGKDLTKTVKVEMKTASPSKVMEQLGAWTMEGFALGAENLLPRVQETMSQLSTLSANAGRSSVEDSYAYTGGYANTGAYGSGGESINTSRIEQLLTVLIQELRAKNMTANVTLAGSGADYGGMVTFAAGTR